MTEQEQIRKELQDQLEKVKHRLELLDMLDERLFEMKDLAQRVLDEELTKREIKKINKRVKYLEEQVKLLEGESNLQS